MAYNISLLLLNIMQYINGLDGGSLDHRILLGKVIKPRPCMLQIFSTTKNSRISENFTNHSIEQQTMIPLPIQTPQFLPSPTPKRNRPGKRERMRKRKAEKRIEEMIANDEMTSIEFEVEDIEKICDDNGNFVSFRTTWATTDEHPFSFYHNPSVLIEKCKDYKNKTEEETKKDLRELAGKLDGVDYTDE